MASVEVVAGTEEAGVDSGDAAAAEEEEGAVTMVAVTMELKATAMVMANTMTTVVVTEVATVLPLTAMAVIARKEDGAVKEAITEAIIRIDDGEWKSITNIL